MTRNKLALSLSVVLVFAILVIAYAQDPFKDKLIPYKFLTTIEIPGGLVGFDISWVDSDARRYYLADRGNPTVTPKVLPRIDVIDTKHLNFLFSIEGTPEAPFFAGPNGVVAIHGTDDKGHGRPSAGELWVGDADSTAKVVDLDNPFAIPFSISTGGTGRADELAFDPRDEIILIANDRAADLFVTFISTESRMVLGKIHYDGTPGNPKACDLMVPPNCGIEQPVWDGAKGKFYLAIPATTDNLNGEVDEIDPNARVVNRRFPTTCGPAGLALIPGQRLMTSCGDVLDIATGTVLHTVTPAVGGDEIWFNPGDERVYFGGFMRIKVPVVDALNYSLIDTLTVGVINTPPTPSHTTHSVAADSALNRVFVPVSHEGVKVYTDDNDNGQGPPLK